MAYTPLNLGYRPQAGYGYDGTTDSQADWASVPNDTYFFDLDTQQVYYKDINGGVYGAYAGGESTLNTYNVSSSQWSKTAPPTLLTSGSTANGLTFFRDDLYASELTLGSVVGTGYVTATGLATSTTGSGTGMTVDIVAVGGDVTSVTINNPGFGYTLNDVITILQGGSSNDETATVTDLASDKSNPVVASATLTGIMGSAYVTANNVPTTGGTGVGLTFDIVAVSGNIVSITINDKGNNYSEGDVVTIVQGGVGANNQTAILTVYPAGTTPYDVYNIAYGLSIQLTGGSGTANVSFDGGVTNYLATFNTDLFTTASDFVATHQTALNAQNIRVFALGSGTDGRLRFCAPRTTLLNMTIANAGIVDLSGNIIQEFTGGTEPKPDHLLIPYAGKPYFGKRIQHFIRVNFNVNTGAVKYANLQLRRYANDSIIGSSIPVQRYDGTSGITGQQHNFVTYTASPVDSFVLGGFYFALENVSNADWTIEGAVGVLVQNVFDTEISF